MKSLSFSLPLFLFVGRKGVEFRGTPSMQVHLASLDVDRRRGFIWREDPWRCFCARFSVVSVAAGSLNSKCYGTKGEGEWRREKKRGAIKEVGNEAKRVKGNGEGRRGNTRELIEKKKWAEKKKGEQRIQTPERFGSEFEEHLWRRRYIQLKFRNPRQDQPQTKIPALFIRLPKGGNCFLREFTLELETNPSN